jgi:hypothetical protein
MTSSACSSPFEAAFSRTKPSIAPPFTWRWVAVKPCGGSVTQRISEREIPTGAPPLVGFVKPACRPSTPLRPSSSDSEPR